MPPDTSPRVSSCSRACSSGSSNRTSEFPNRTSTSSLTMSPPTTAQGFAAGSLFLGLDIGVERICATLVDSQLGIVEDVFVELDEVSRGMGKPELL
jgi:hypothetical protein